MIVQVEKEFNKIEEQRKQLFREVEKLSHEQQNFKPSPDSWSILQVFNHIITAEKNSLAYLKKKVLGAEKVKKAGIAASARSTALNTFLKMPVKFKAPQAALPNFEEIYFFENVAKEWDDVREGLRKFLDHLDLSNAKKMLYKHPVAGRMNIFQALSFYYEHLEHHKKQIERIKEHPQFPS